MTIKGDIDALLVRVKAIEDRLSIIEGEIDSNLQGRISNKQDINDINREVARLVSNVKALIEKKNKKVC